MRESIKLETEVKISMGLIIVTDSSSDLRGEDLNKYNVKVVPLNVSFGDEHYKEGVDIQIDEFYDKLAKSKVFPKTSQPSPQEYVNIYTEAKKNGDTVLVITISTGLSGTYQAACLAKDIAEYDDVYVCDSLSCLTGLRCLVINACKLRDSGLSAKEIFDKLEVLKHHIHIFSIVDNLEGFLKGGRLSRAEYAIGSLLNLKPFITLNKEGKIIKNGQSLGYHKAYVVASKQNQKYPIDPQYGLFYGYTIGEDKIKKYIEKTFNQFGLDQYDLSRIGCASGSHIGCGGCCFAYISNKERDE